LDVSFAINKIIPNLISNVQMKHYSKMAEISIFEKSVVSN